MALPITPALVVAAGAVRPARCPDLWTGPAHGRASAPLHGIPRQPVLDRLHRPDANSSCPSVDCVTRFGKRDDPPGRQPRSAGGQHHEADGERRLVGPMAILHALLPLLSRSLGNIMSALFGWAVMALLGKALTRKRGCLHWLASPPRGPSSWGWSGRGSRRSPSSSSRCRIEVMTIA